MIYNMSKRITIDSELRSRIVKQYKRYQIREPWYSGPHSRNFDLLRTYAYTDTIRNDIYEELCGII